jgi:hypothetical protein
MSPPAAVSTVRNINETRKKKKRKKNKNKNLIIQPGNGIVIRLKKNIKQKKKKNAVQNWRQE